MESSLTQRPSVGERLLIMQNRRKREGSKPRKLTCRNIIYYIQKQKTGEKRRRRRINKKLATNAKKMKKSRKTGSEGRRLTILNQRDCAVGGKEP